MRWVRYHQAADDIDAAAVLGCRDAQFWSKHASQPVINCVDDGRNDILLSRSAPDR
jgi:hypothetical protein